MGPGMDLKSAKDKKSSWNKKRLKRKGKAGNGEGHGDPRV